MNDDTKSVENLTNENIDESAENTAGNAENPDVKTEKISESVPEKQSYNFVNVSDEKEEIPEKSVKGEGKNNFVLLCLLFAILLCLFKHFPLSHSFRSKKKSPVNTLQSEYKAAYILFAFSEKAGCKSGE